MANPAHNLPGDDVAVAFSWLRSAMYLPIAQGSSPPSTDICAEPSKLFILVTVSYSCAGRNGAYSDESKVMI